jgi:DNA-binding response OmpR family regulator
MNVAMLPRTVDESWRTPGCGERCRTHTVQFPGRYYSERLAMHDPDHHEAYGQLTAARKYLPLDGQLIRTGGIVIDGSTYTVTVHGRDVPLTPTERNLLFFFAHRLNRICARAEVMREIWGEAYAAVPARRFAVHEHSSYHILRVNIGRLRAKLGTEGRLLVTQPAIGYRLLDVPSDEP